jgi:UDP-N-acetylglucosamine--N-acetylmuramyl-(pentapeptide) pyrophosphoryl-undecaprenol N-acetylglucosamine transferase
MGGYVAGPPVMAALLRRIPVVVMEPNAVPGFTNRSIGKLVYRALISFEETAAHFPKGRTELTGLPVREAFFNIQPKPRGASFNVLVTGGSQGSRTLNEAGRQSWPLFAKAGNGVSVFHQTGAGSFDGLRQDFERSGMAGEITPFVADMPSAFADADLIVCRAGAGAVAEVAAAGKPAILVPFPFAADDHQTRNAEAMERNGAAVMVRDAELNGENLFELVSQLAADPERLEKMGVAARKMAKPGAARRAADILEQAAGEFH